MANVQLEGAFDGIEGADALGWIRLRSDPEIRLSVGVSLNGKITNTVIADQYRPDLEDLGFGDGRYGFDIPIPIASLMEPGTYDVQVVAMSGEKFVGSFPAKQLTVDEETTATLIDSTIKNQSYKMSQGKCMDTCIARVSELLLLSPDSRRVHDWINEQRKIQGSTITLPKSEAFKALRDELANYQNLLAQVESSLKLQQPQSK